MKNQDDLLLETQSKIVEGLSDKQLPVPSEKVALTGMAFSDSLTNVCLRNAVVCFSLIVATALMFFFISRLHEAYTQLDRDGLLTYSRITKKIEQDPTMFNRWSAFKNAGWTMIDRYMNTRREHWHDHRDFHTAILLFRKAISEADRQSHGDCMRARILRNIAWLPNA